MKMHFYMFESFRLERLYVTNLLHRSSVNVCSKGTREESKELPVLSLFACIMATLNRNFIGCNWGPVYGNIATSDRGPAFQDVEKELRLVGKSQECKLGGNKCSLVYVKDSAKIIQLCGYWLSCGLEEQSLLPRMSKRGEERGDWTVKIKHEWPVCLCMTSMSSIDKI